MRPYLRQGRLADVVGLIQVLALDESSHRSENGLRDEMQGKPQSAANWKTIAQEHGEFFRVRPEGENVVSLLTHHVSRNPETGRPPLSLTYVQELLRTAVAIQERELDLSRRRHIWIPFAGAIVGGVGAVLVSHILR